MPTISLPVRPGLGLSTRPLLGDVVALVGNPNAGKTTLFNALTGLRAKTANFPGTTIEHRHASLNLDGQRLTLVDLPGLYTLEAASAEERVARDALVGRIHGLSAPRAVLLLLDASNLDRNLFLAAQVVELCTKRGIPMVAALNMVDIAHKEGITVDPDALAGELGCHVVPIVARSGKNLAELQKTLAKALDTPPHAEVPQRLSTCTSCSGCPFSAKYDWAEQVAGQCTDQPAGVRGKKTEAVDRVLTHKLFGVGAFLGVMLATFWLIFAIAQYPMGWIELLFGTAGEVVGSVLPTGGWWDDLHSLIVDGIIGGVGGMLVFLPQICILFFCLALLEDTGYMARAAFVMDRLMHRVGLPGKAFVPLLSAHACAIPAIMSTRVIEDKRDRLVTILIAPLMSCSARVPVYALVIALLFANQPMMAAVTFAGAYVLGIVAAMLMAFVFKRTILPGEPKALVIELPGYKAPNFRNAFYLMLDRAWLFIKKAGTIILLLSIGLWFLATYPKTDPPAEVTNLYAQAELLEGEQAEELIAQADQLEAQAALDGSFAGMIGSVIEPVFEPLGFDKRMSIGVVMSFAAREVIVSTLGVLYGLGEEADEGSLLGKLHSARRSDGTPVFTTAACLSLLVFYVLAMQCLPTQAVTRRETGTWKWPIIQFAYMTVLAYSGALVTYQIASAVLS